MREESDVLGVDTVPGLDRLGFIGYERHLEQRRRRAEPHAQNKLD